MRTLFSNSLFALVFAIAAVCGGYAQTGDTANVTEPDTSAVKVVEKQSPANAPAMSEIRGVKLGMTADEVIKILGKPESKDEQGIYFKLSNGEALQLALDGEKKVTTFSMMYVGKGAKAPELTAVFGGDVKPDSESDGNVFKRVRYPELGIWVAYSRIGDGDNPMTTVTIQKIRQ